jgi:TonB family protein
MRNRTGLDLVLLASMLMFSPPRARSQDPSEGLRKVKNQVTPQYPSLARSMSLRGNVRVEVLVAPNGAVKSLEVKGGHPLLVDAAQNAVRQWKWEPAAHETHESVELKFTP